MCDVNLKNLHLYNNNNNKKRDKNKAFKFISASYIDKL